MYYVLFYYSQYIVEHPCLLILKYLIYINTLFTYTISQEHFFQFPFEHTDLGYDFMMDTNLSDPTF